MVNKILNNNKFKVEYEKIQKLEQDRIYCKHNMNHFLDVARISYIDVLENGYPISGEVVYAMALLHDIGKAKQYEQNIPHNESGAILAEEILRECGFRDKDIKDIARAIFLHREKTDYPKNSLVDILYRADKKSRNCFECQVKDSCNWSEKQKNNCIFR